MFEEIKDPVMCPYCSSIDNDGITCRWCRNKITDDYESEEQPMNVELRFTGLTPKLALKLIEVVNESGEQPDIGIPSPARNATPVTPAPMPAVTSAPGMTHVSHQPPTYQMPAAPTAVSAFAPAPAAPPQNSPAPAYQPVPSAVPTAAPTAPAPQYDVEMLGRAAAPLAAAGKRQELYNLLQSFGVQSINELPKERYGEMAIALRGLGAQI